MPKTIKYNEAEFPLPGSVFLVPLAQGKFGVIRVLRRKTVNGFGFALLVPSPWVGTEPRRPTDKEIRIPLILTHHSWDSRHAAAWTSLLPPASLIPAGKIGITLKDRFFQSSHYSSWETCTQQILIQWRWDHDRENLLRDDHLREEKEAEFQKKKAEMLRTLTLESLSVKVWFESWDEEENASMIHPARSILAQLVNDLLQAPKITKPAVRQLLKAAVNEFNRFEKHSHPIDTIQREDIYEALESVMFAARQPELVDEIDTWKSW